MQERKLRQIRSTGAHTMHYHLLLETPEANLSRAMHWLNTSYGWFNRRHRRHGHLLQLAGDRFGPV